MAAAIPTVPSHAVYDSRHVPKSAFACDVHTHTLASIHAYSTLGECVAAARAAGLELLSSTDHYSCMISSSLHVRDYAYFINFDMWPRVWDGVYVMRGVEADIVDLQGNLFGWNIPVREGITGRAYPSERTLKEIVWRDIDYAIASIHDGTFTALTDWTYWDLSSLGLVESIYFTMTSTDVGDWGTNTSTYFALSHMTVAEPENTGVSEISNADITGVKYYNLAGVASDAPFDGVNIVVTSRADGTQSTTKICR